MAKNIRVCNLCWKNLTSKPATIIRIKSNNRNYLICNQCLDKHEELKKDENLELIFSTPTYKEMEK